MSWYNPIDVVKGAVNGVVKGATSVYDKVTEDPGGDAEKKRKSQLYGLADEAGAFANRSQRGYANYGRQGQSALAGLQATALGQNSISGEQLRQGVQQLQAQQQSIAAGASPQNAAMAARTAAIQSGRLGMGLAGQQALAGLQERQQAQQAYASLLQGLRAQDLQAALASRQNAMSGYSAGNSGAPEKSWLDKYGPTILAGAQLAV